MLAERQGDRIHLDIPITYKDVVRRVPGARYSDGAWTVPLSWAACLQVRAEFGTLMDIGSELTAWAEGYVQNRTNIMQFKNGELAYAVDERLAAPQQIGSSWLATTGRALLADEMRTGKSPMSIEALELLGEAAFPALIICPNTMKFVWQDEFAKWYPAARVQVVHGTAAVRRKQFEAEADVFVVSWDLLRIHSRLAPYGSLNLSDKERKRQELNEIGFKTVIADEAHRGADPSSKQTRAWWFVSHEATYRWALTGTPVVNRPSDLFSIMHAIAPEEYPVRSAWIERYCVTGQGKYGFEIYGLRQEHQSELFQVLDPRFMRRTLAEVRPFMPERMPPEFRYMSLEGPQATLYKKLKKDMLAEVDGDYIVEGSALTLGGRLLQVATATPVVEDGVVVALKKPSIKVDALFDVLNEYEGEPLVVFAASRKLIELCARELDKKKVSNVLITGAVDPQLRAANIARFQIGEAQVALCTTGAGAEGITLNRARRTLFLQRDWSAVKNTQAASRTDGQAHGDPLETIIAVTSDTLEERTLNVGDMKIGYMQEILRDELRLSG